MACKGGWAAVVTVVGLGMGGPGCSGPAASPVDGSADEDAGGVDAGQDAGAADAGQDASMEDAGQDGASCQVIRPEPEAPDLEALCGAVPTTLDAWEDCYLQRVCAWTVQCGDQTPYRDVEECVAWWDAASGGRYAAERRERQRAVAQGRAAVDEDHFARCLAGFDPGECNRGGVRSRLRPSCGLRFEGTVGAGDPCYADVECASPGGTCERDGCTDGCCEGTCAPAIPEGGDCLVGQCEPGLFCAVGDRCSHTGHSFCCLPRPEVGEPCSSNYECEAGAWCDGECGVCREALPEGAECTLAHNQCGGQTACVGLSIIHGDPGRCVRVTEPGADCDSICYGSLYCGPINSPTHERTCHRLEGVGEHCGGGGFECFGIEVSCTGTDGLCTEGLVEGEPCGVGPPCVPGLFCTSDLGDEAPECAAPQEAGAPCTLPSHCASHRCSGDDEEPGTCLPWVQICPE